MIRWGMDVPRMTLECGVGPTKSWKDTFSTIRRPGFGRQRRGRSVNAAWLRGFPFF